MKDTNSAEVYASNVVESIDEFTKETVYELVKKAYEDGLLVNNSEELQLLDIDDIEDDLQIEEYSDAIDANMFLSKLL